MHVQNISQPSYKNLAVHQWVPTHWLGSAALSYTQDSCKVPLNI